MPVAEVTRYNGTTGEIIAAVIAKMQQCDTTYKPYGGCESASLRFVAPWGSSFVCETGEELVVRKNSVPVFAGRVMSLEPDLNSEHQNVSVSGWWKRLDEILIVEPPADRITFGVTNGDYPDAVKVKDVVRILLDDYILADAYSPIIEGTVEEAQYSCKLGPTGFAIYANDSLAKVMETLAMMDDCVVGIDAERQFYWIPRTTVEDTTAFTAQVAEAVPAGWRNQPRGLITGGRFIQDRRGPNFIGVESRDINLHRGIRTYKNASALDGTRRLVMFKAHNIRHGQSSRRLARGIFRRFSDFTIKVEDVNFIMGNAQRMEPHLGTVKVTNGGVEVANKIAGTINVNWLGTIKGSVTLGENKPDAGSGNPLNDPLVDDGQLDDPQIDTGDSSTIDFDDGFDGDGDDLHTNDDRDVWTDPAGLGVDPLDYGTETIDDENGAGGGGGSTVGNPVRKGRISAVAGIDSVTVQEFNYEETAVVDTHSGVKFWPKLLAMPVVGQEVGIYFNQGKTVPTAIGNSACEDDCQCNGTFAD